MYHIFFIHSSVDGHLDCFHVLTIVDHVSVNIGVHASFGSCFSLNICPGVGLKGYMVAEHTHTHTLALFLVFQGTSILFFGLPQLLSGKLSACNEGATGDMDSIHGSGKSPGVGLHSSILAWRIPWTEKPSVL